MELFESLEKPMDLLLRKMVHLMFVWVWGGWDFIIKGNTAFQLEVGKYKDNLFLSNFMDPLKSVHGPLGDLLNPYITP